MRADGMVRNLSHEQKAAFGLQLGENLAQSPTVTTQMAGVQRGGGSHAAPPNF